MRVIFLVGLVGVERKARIVRIVIANSPRMYRESLAISIIREHPQFEVLIVPPHELDGQVERFKPHVLINDGADTDAPDGVLLWIGIMIDDHLNARIAVNGKISELRDISFTDLLAALDEVTEILSADVRGGKARPSA